MFALINKAFVQDKQRIEIEVQVGNRIAIFEAIDTLPLGFLPMTIVRLSYKY